MFQHAAALQGGLGLPPELFALSLTSLLAYLTLPGIEPGLVAVNSTKSTHQYKYYYIVVICAASNQYQP